MTQKEISTWTRADYERAAEEYQANLPPEHYMEATPHAAQREITIESFAILRLRRHDVHLCNELLVQSPINAHLVQVCPDNMVVLQDEPLEAMGSFNTPFEAGRISWVLEYVSPSNKRKDYVDNFHKCQDELQIPYYLIFDPGVRDLRLFQHNGIAYERVTPNSAGRLPVPELEVEVALLDGWVRFWHQGDLLPLPADLQQEVDELMARLKEARRQVRELKKRADEAARQSEQARSQVQRQKKRAEQEKRRADEAEAEIKRLRALLEKSQRGDQ